jgi:hypothetical protein
MDTNDEDRMADRAFDEAAQCVRGLERVRGGRVRRSIKCVLVPARIGAEPVMIKSVFAKAPLWRWYLAREAELYRSFEASGGLPVPVRAPRLYAATDSLMVRSRFVGRELATKRHEVMKDDESWRDVHALLGSIAAITIEPPKLARDEVSSQMMRHRLLEDPDDPVGWVVDGFIRAVALEIVTPDEATTLRQAIEADANDPSTAPSMTFAHGDLLLRNIIRDRGDRSDRSERSATGALSLIDWECAGIYLKGWDAALVSVWSPSWFQELLKKEDPSPRFAALRAWALIREINYRLKRPASDAITLRLKAALTETLKSLSSS